MWSTLHSICGNRVIQVFKKLFVIKFTHNAAVRRRMCEFINNLSQSVVMSNSQIITQDRLCSAQPYVAIKAHYTSAQAIWIIIVHAKRVYGRMFPLPNVLLLPCSTIHNSLWYDYLVYPMMCTQFILFQLYFSLMQLFRLIYSSTLLYFENHHRLAIYWYA